MKQLNKRVLKIEENMSAKVDRSELAPDPMSLEEVEQIYKKTLEGPCKPLFHRTREGYVNVFDIKPWHKLQPIYYAYAQKQIDLYSEDDLKEMGVEPG